MMNDGTKNLELALVPSDMKPPALVIIKNKHPEEYEDLEYEETNYHTNT